LAIIGLEIGRGERGDDVAVGVKGMVTFALIEARPGKPTDLAVDFANVHSLSIGYLYPEVGGEPGGVVYFGRGGDRRWYSSRAAGNRMKMKQWGGSLNRDRSSRFFIVKISSFTLRTVLFSLHRSIFSR
jgi:hypothetical protein